LGLFFPWKKKIWLVVLTILKNMSSSVGKDYPIYIVENKKMFETTNQDLSHNLARLEK